MTILKRGLIEPNAFKTFSTEQEIFELVRKEDIDSMMKPFTMASKVERLHYVGVDLFTHYIKDAINEMDDEFYELYLNYHYAICERADLVGITNHALDVFRKKDSVEALSQNYSFKKATAGQRIGAYFIDFMMLLIMFAFMASFFPNMPGWFALIALFVLVGIRDAYRGQSFGKLVFGIGVRDHFDNFTVPHISRLFLRQVFSFLWPVEFFAMILNYENRKLGDKLAGTCVYNLQDYKYYLYRLNYAQSAGGVNYLQRQAPTPYKPQKLKIAGILLAVVLVVAGFIFSIGMVLRNHESYRLATDYIRASPEIAEYIGEVRGFGFMPTGSISTSPGRGDASFSIRVRGTYGNVRVFAVLQKRYGGNWELVRYNFVVLE